MSEQTKNIGIEQPQARQGLDLHHAIAELERRAAWRASYDQGMDAEQQLHLRAALLQFYQPYEPNHDAVHPPIATSAIVPADPVQQTDANAVQISLLTQHKKLPLIASALMQYHHEPVNAMTADITTSTGADIPKRIMPWQHSAWQLLDQYDTDQLGTFSGDIARVHSQFDTAILKAKLAAILGGGRIGVGSEGSVAPGPAGAWFPYHTEMVAWWDEALQWAVVGYAHAPAQSRVQIATDLASLQAQWQSHDYQQQALQMKVLDGGDAVPSVPIVKGIRNEAELCQAWLQLHQIGASVEVSYDYRAHCSQRRQQVIVSAAKDLAQRLTQTCPCCATPGFVVTDTIKGLPCAACDLPTQQVKTLIYQCQHCGYQQQISTKTTVADPMHCQFCNP